MATHGSASAARRAVIAQHSFGEPGSGGPIGALERILASDLRERYAFVRMHQGRATGGVDVPRLREWTRKLRELRPDLVHVRGLGSEGFHGALAARLAGCPRVLVSIHGTVRDLEAHPTVKQRVIVAALEPATLRMATHVTTVCDYAAQRPFVQKHADKLVGPIVNGVVPEGRATALERAEVRAELRIDPSQVALISVGRLSNEKGHRDLGEALSALSADLRSTLVLVVAGNGPDRAEIEATYRDCGVETRLLGRRLDVPRLLGAADVFVFPTLHENLSNALLEAMGRALPVIATRVGGNTEVINRGGGLLVPPADPAALARAIEGLIVDPHRRDMLGESGLAVVREHYSVERMCEVLDHTYRRILTEVR